METKIYNILIVEDEWITAEFTSDTLSSLGHNVVGVYGSSDEVLPVIESDEIIDLIFMDININGAIDGISLAKHIAKLRDIPIIYITAFSDTQTLDEACETNLYGFISKPYAKRDIELSLGVALQRIKKEHNKNQEKEVLMPQKLDLGNAYSYDLQEAKLFYQGYYVPCTNNEAKLLHLFCKNYDNVVSLEEIQYTIWKDKDIGISTIRDTISRIRRKLPTVEIVSVTGIGYILKKQYVST